MRLTRFTDNALRVLMFTALAGERKSTISEIADACAVPRNHLVKVINAMARKGFLETTRGKGGGVRLARDPADISIGAVVREMEETLDVVDCTSPYCPLVPGCDLRGALSEATEAFLSTLDRYTVADMLSNKAQLRRLVGVELEPAV